jgi:hypothetical protein
MDHAARVRSFEQSVFHSVPAVVFTGARLCPEKNRFIMDMHYCALDQQLREFRFGQFRLTSFYWYLFE